MGLQELNPSAFEAGLVRQRVDRGFDEMLDQCSFAEVCERNFDWANGTYYFMVPAEFLAQADGPIVVVPSQCFAPKGGGANSLFQICTNFYSQITQYLHEAFVGGFELDLTDHSTKVLIGDFDQNGFLDAAVRFGETTKIFMGDGIIGDEGAQVNVQLVTPSVPTPPDKILRAKPVAFAKEKPTDPQQPAFSYSLSSSFSPQDHATIGGTLSAIWRLLQDHFPQDGRINPFKPHRSPVSHSDSVLTIAPLEEQSALVDRVWQKSSSGTSVPFATKKCFEVWYLQNPHKILPSHIEDLASIPMIGLTIEPGDLSDPHFREEFLITVTGRMVVAVPQYLGGKFNTEDVMNDTVEPNALEYLKGLIAAGKISAYQFDLAYLQQRQTTVAK